MIDCRGDSYMFSPFQDIDQQFEVSNLEMTDLYALIEEVSSGKFEANPDTVQKSRIFITGILAAENILNVLDNQMVEICQDIITKCGVTCKQYFDVGLKIHRNKYWSNLAQYVCRFLDKHSSYSSLRQSNLINKRTVCCSGCVCLKYISNADCIDVCITCKHGLEFHVDINRNENIRIKFNSQYLQPSRIQNDGNQHNTYISISIMQLYIFVVNSFPITSDLSEIADKKCRLADSTNEGVRVVMFIVTSYIFLYFRCC